MYRYRILSYNVLGRVGAASEWVGIRVFVAKQPAAQSFEPQAYFVDSLAEEFTLTVRGGDLAEEGQLHIVRRRKGAKPVLPLSIKYSPDEDYLEAVFPGGGLELGSYDVVITNPGGMRQTLQGFHVGFTRPTDIAVSLGYAPVFPASGYLFDSYTETTYPLGFYARASVLPIKRLWGWIGFELALDYTGLKTQTDTYALSGDMAAVTAGALLQKWFRDYTLAMNLRLGAGMAAVANIEFEHPGGVRSEKKTSLLVALNAGASAQWMVSDYIFIEGGAEFVQLVSSHSPPPGFFRLFAGAGARF